MQTIGASQRRQAHRREIGTPEVNLPTSMWYKNIEADQPYHHKEHIVEEKRQTMLRLFRLAGQAREMAGKTSSELEKRYFAQISDHMERQARKVQLEVSGETASPAPTESEAREICTNLFRKLGVGEKHGNC